VEGAMPTRIPAQNRLAAAFAFAVMVIGCLVMWIGVPIAAFWLAGELATSPGYHAPIALAIIVPGMFGVAIVLAWVNQLWLRITGGEVVNVRGVPVERRGPLEILLPVSGVIAFIALVVWFFVAAENPSSQFL
jgi:hypothetical protein